MNAQSFFLPDLSDKLRCVKMAQEIHHITVGGGSDNPTKGLNIANAVTEYRFCTVSSFSSKLDLAHRM
jgi:hypothetical protein